MRNHIPQFYMGAIIYPCFHSDVGLSDPCLWKKPLMSNESWWRHQMKTFSALLAFVWGIHRSPVNSPHKDQWRGALMFSLICAWINGWVNNRETGELICHRAHYDVTVMVGCHWHPPRHKCAPAPIRISYSSPRFNTTMFYKSFNIHYL